jgi:hypothetical protein
MSDNRELDGALKIMYQKHEVIELTPAQAKAILCELERLWEVESRYERTLIGVQRGDELVYEPVREAVTRAEKWRDSYREVAR